MWCGVGLFCFCLDLYLFVVVFVLVITVNSLRRALLGQSYRDVCPLEGQIKGVKKRRDQL